MNEHTVWLLFVVPILLMGWWEYAAARDHRRARQRDQAYLDDLERLLRDFAICRHEPTVGALLASAYLRAIQRGKTK